LSLFLNVFVYTRVLEKFFVNILDYFDEFQSFWVKFVN